ncbi:sporulation protein YunB [Paenibacillus sp. J31TS4]|uniref:sporulation protein YunB n=1 Tax=Paenibacillus sp. J31TS4 TaxID=2807195 RepID=UPI0020BF2E72|nr:sporulation protein YunB [Paenibacillus sp. J31TS4]
MYQQNRWKSRTPRKKSRRRIIFVVLLLIMLFSMQSFIYLDKNLKRPLMNLAQIRVKQIATQAINSAITDRINEGTNFDKLIEWKYDNQGKITGFMLNYAEHMRITSQTIGKVQGVLADLQQMPEHIPLGQALDSPILASFGPDIPVRLVPAGAVKVELDTRPQNIGINMILVEVYIRILAEVTIIIPFDSKPELVETNVPISYLLVVGDTPMYYMDNKGNPVGQSGPLPPGVTLPNLPANISGAGKTGGADAAKAGAEPASSGAPPQGEAATPH